MTATQELKATPSAQMARRTLDWIKANSLADGGVIVSSKRHETYDEVTGYLIPTLFDAGEEALAVAYIRHLLASQRPEGAWGLGGKAYLFDTAQVVEGLTAALGRDDNSDLRRALARAVGWALSRVDSRGLFDAADHDAGITEQVHLRSARNLHLAALALGDRILAAEIEKVALNYLRQPRCLDPGVLSHFHAYELDGVAYFQPGRALVALRAIASRIRPDGAIAAKPGVNWVCNPGVAQYAILFAQFGMTASARRCLHYLTRAQQVDGGFTGGDGEYFADAQISWAAKFALDAHNILTRQEPSLAMPPRAGRPPSRLLVITEQPLDSLASNGWDGDYLSRYFNPAGLFSEVRLFDWGMAERRWPGLQHQALVVPPAPEIEAWMDSLTRAQALKPLTDDALRTAMSALPRAWLDAVREFAPDVIRAYGARWSGFVAQHLGHELRAPVLVSVHNVSELAIPVLREAQNVMAVSDAAAEACIDAGAAPAKIVTVHNRVDRLRFKPGVAAPAAAPEGSPRLLCVARDVPQKNLDRLLAACELARKRHPGLRLVHAGTSNRDWSKISFATHFDALPQVELAGWYGWADALVLPSLWEGFGIVLAEALACGTPCITSNRPPMSDIVHDRWDGLLVDPENANDIARAIEEIADPSLQARLAVPARVASEPFDIAVIEARESALYRTLALPRVPLVSVVLPTFNRARLIEAAVRNVLAQDHENIELIVVNDGSTDGTGEVLAQLTRALDDPRLRIIHTQNGGLPSALNTGFGQARGEYLTWTSDDNAYRPGALSAMVRELELDPEAALVFADYELFDASGMPRHVVRTGPLSELATHNVIGACFMYRHIVAKQVGAYDRKRELAEDYDYWLRISRVGKLIHLNRVLYDYGDTPDSLTNRRRGDVAMATYRLHSSEGADAELLRGQLARLAGEYKSRGMPLKSLGAAARLIGRWPLNGAGYWALARALVPLPILRLSRKLRGADAG